MEIFNVGPLELLLILLIALIVFGPQDMVKYAQQMARWINKIVRSPIWKSFMDTSQEIRTLPTKIMREANLEESLEEIRKTAQAPYELPTLKDIPDWREQAPTENRIAPDDKTGTGKDGDAPEAKIEN